MRIAIDLCKDAAEVQAAVIRRTGWRLTWSSTPQAAERVAVYDSPDFDSSKYASNDRIVLVFQKG